MTRIHDPFRRAQLAIAALFLFLGFQYATWVSRLPTLKTQLDLNAAQVGLLLMAGGAGAVLSFPLVPLVMKRLGSRRASLLSALVLGLILPALAVTPDYPVTLLVICLDGVAVGFLNVAMNAQGAALEVAYERTVMARFHATFSAGSLSAALLAVGVNLYTRSLAVHFVAAAVLLLLAVGLTKSGLLTQDQQAGSAPDATAEGAADSTAEQPEQREQPEQAEPPAAPKRRLPLPTRVTIWMGLAMVFGTVTEGAMNDWSSLYLKDIAEAGPEVAPLGIAVVSGMMVLARIFADGWRARWGDGRIVVAGSALAGAGLAVALLAGGVLPALLGFACVGLGVAAVTPCVYVAAARQGPEALALVAAMGTIGLLAGPPVIGFIASGSSLVWGMGAVAASAALVSLCATRIHWPALADA